MGNEEYLKIAEYLKSQGLVKIRNFRKNEQFFYGEQEVLTTEVQLTKKGEKYLYDNWITDIKELFEITKREIDNLLN